MEKKFDDALKAAKGKITIQLSPDDMTKATQAVLNLIQARGLYRVIQKPTDELNDEIGIALSRVRSALPAIEMMKSTQAVLNIMHAKAQVEAK